MKTPTFREQYDKIVGAYLRNELNPFINCACFVGNLLNNNDLWSLGRDFVGNCPIPELGYYYDSAGRHVSNESGGLYSMEEIIHLEKTFLLAISKKWTEMNGLGQKPTEDQLFNAMAVTLEELKKLHESKGERVEDYVFERRELKEEKV